MIWFARILAFLIVVLIVLLLGMVVTWSGEDIHCDTVAVSRFGPVLDCD